ncbi:hypothetical protein J2S22_005523 [Rhodoplanes tepidamans]|uniref:hypothetical protein n=1 Tax=Rhodoplanes tepidamans TaxID=200616 RepID=UPI0027855137|nr:hypothetical protein [Rhodoplanes tepidamans]MDQ0358569.1 hypothetical protein [Rhodoplanes tepidamans]
MYYFKGRGFLWHDSKGPVLWWPLNWVWFGVFELKRWREDKKAERAARRAAKAGARGPSPEAGTPPAGSPPAGAA